MAEQSDKHSSILTGDISKRFTSRNKSRKHGISVIVKSVRHFFDTPSGDDPIDPVWLEDRLRLMSEPDVCLSASRYAFLATSNFIFYLVAPIVVLLGLMSPSNKWMDECLDFLGNRLGFMLALVFPLLCGFTLAYLIGTLIARYYRDELQKQIETSWPCVTCGTSLVGVEPIGVDGLIQCPHCMLCSRPQPQHCTDTVRFYQKHPPDPQWKRTDAGADNFLVPATFTGGGSPISLLDWPCRTFSSALDLARTLLTNRQLGNVIRKRAESRITFSIAGIAWGLTIGALAVYLIMLFVTNVRIGIIFLLLCFMAFTIYLVQWLRIRINVIGWLNMDRICLACGYPLRSLQTKPDEVPHCPECGIVLMHLDEWLEREATRIRRGGPGIVTYGIRHDKPKSASI